MAASIGTTTHDGSLSFLSLPAEIRNTIYSLLFEHEDPVYALSDLRHRGTKLHRRIGDQNFRLFNPNESSKAYWDKINHEASAFVNVRQPGIAMFFVCRQIYEEASSVFYKNNTFAMSRICMWSENSHQYDVKPICKRVVAWLRQLGSRAFMIPRLQIDLDTLCPPDCPFNRRTRMRAKGIRSLSNLDIWPLLSYLWSSGLQLEVILMHSQNKCHGKAFDYHGDWHNLSVRPGLDLPALNALLHALRFDDLGIRMYWRTIHAVQMKRNGSGGIVVYKSASQYFRYAFDADQGRNPRMLSEPAPTFATLPDRVRSQILDEALVYPHITKLSRETAPLHLAQINQAQVCYEWRNHYGKHFAQGEKLTVELKSSSREAELLDLDPLGSLLWKTYSPMTVHQQEWPYYSKYVSCKFAVIFELEENTVTALDDVRFNATPLIQATLRGYYVSDIIRIVISVPNIAAAVSGSRTVVATSHITIARLRTKILDAWSQPDAKSAKPRKKCPQFWVNGHGTVIDIIEQMTWEEVDSRGMPRYSREEIERLRQEEEAKVWRKEEKEVGERSNWSPSEKRKFDEWLSQRKRRYNGLLPQYGPAYATHQYLMMCADRL